MFFGPENTAFLWDKYTAVIYLRKMFTCLTREEKDAEHTSSEQLLLSTGFLYSFKGDAVRLSNFAVTQINSPLLTKAKTKTIQAERLATASLAT